MPTEFRTTPCSSCGRPIVWGVDGEGQRIPLDPRPPVYHVAQTEDGRAVLVSRNRAAMVSHFATCPHASQHTRSRKAQADPIAGRATS